MGRAAACGLALLAGLGALAGCTGPPANSTPQAQPGTDCRLVVAITTSHGTTWGTVAARVGGRRLAFTGPERSVAVSCRVTARLSETPTDSAAWPFAAWLIGSHSTASVHASTLVNGVVRVRAVYAPAAAASPGEGPSPG
ncbi:MAG: hypothetical protein ACREOD_08390 [Candidatus Dormibacteria bacterium]